ncbi:hypothetical protein A3Q32_20945 [Alcanivorax sp. KX64203]|nr:hypothetical protein A3Q32_20945 [Alcanivorax sp. KX64203]
MAERSSIIVMRLHLCSRGQCAQPQSKIGGNDIQCQSLLAGIHIEMLGAPLRARGINRSRKANQKATVIHRNDFRDAKIARPDQLRSGDH